MIIEDEELRNLYKAASTEHIQNIESGLLHLENNPQDQVTLEQLLREMHSLKGDSRMLGVKDVETLTHQLEEIIGTVKRGKILSSQLLNYLYQGIDAIRKIATEAVGGKPANISVFHILAQLMGADSGEELPENMADLSEIEPPTLSTELLTTEQKEANEIGVAEVGEITGTNGVGTETPPLQQRLTPINDYQIDTIRVDALKLDKLLTQASELIVTKGHIANRVADIEEIMTFLAEWSQEFSLQRPFDEPARQLQTPEPQNLPNLMASFSTLGSLLNRLRSKTDEDSAKLETVANELQSGIHALRLLPFSTIFNLFPRTVRDLAQQQGKEVNLQIEGGDNSVDKRILEEMKDPLLHLLRNAIDHGIETPQERQSLGKPPIATIRLRGYQVGNTVSIEVRDDGRGLDVEAIKQSALRRGICSDAELAQMSTAQIQALIFAPGFSTRTNVTEISGRGVGLDVVHDHVERLNGNIHLEFTPHNGCLFRITLNSSLSSIDALILRVQSHPYALPVAFVESMLLVSPQEVLYTEAALGGGSQTLEFQGESVSVAWLADLLGLPLNVPTSTKALHTASKTIHCLILRIGSERLALLVDEIVEQQDIVLRSQSQLLLRVKNISGATILGTGEVCMVLNPTDLFKSASKVVVSVTVQELARATEIKLKILLVEDSIPIRTQMKRILQAAGYEVTTAVDGEDGFNKLVDDRFVAVVSDVQMPNLSGLELVSKMRQFPEYQDLPVILVTTLATETDKIQGQQAGANAYITKGDFEQGVLLETLRSLIK
ncbi:MAG: hybrid sensor histidine kinase/response regulator [Coleofasciculaceae cyanobacterium]